MVRRLRRPALRAWYVLVSRRARLAPFVVACPLGLAHLAACREGNHATLAISLSFTFACGHMLIMFIVSTAACLSFLIRFDLTPASMYFLIPLSESLWTSCYVMVVIHVNGERV
jgi:hypothetical protein